MIHKFISIMRKTDADAKKKNESQKKKKSTKRKRKDEDDAIASEGEARKKRITGIHKPLRLSPVMAKFLGETEVRICLLGGAGNKLGMCLYWEEGEEDRKD